MNHGIRNSFLYASSRIINHSLCMTGEQCTYGTGFWAKNSKGEICLITNKHVLQAPKGFYRELKLIGINWGFIPRNLELPIKQIPNLTVQEQQHSGISLLYKSTSIIEAINS